MTHAPHFAVTRPRPWTALLAVGLCAMVSLAGCGPSEEEEAKAKAEIVPLAPVDLPPVPGDLGVVEVPDSHADGSLTVDGLRRNRLQHLDQPVSIKGFLVWNYVCPYAEEKKNNRRRPKRKDDAEKKDENLCQRAHFYVADKPRSDERLLVVGLGGHVVTLLEEEKIKVGELYTFKGSYVDIADGFAAPEEGLLNLDVIVGFEPEEDEEEGDN